MKRYNLIQARGGDFTCGTEGIAMEGEGTDVIDLKIRRGKVSILVPAELPDKSVCEEHWINKHICLELELEDGTHLSGWIRGGDAYLQAD
jgi:hypothetical protein